MEDKNIMIVYKENIFSKIKRFFNNIFNKKSEKNVNIDLTKANNAKQEKKFMESISFKENKNELNIINSIRNNIEALDKMDSKELDDVENAILNRMNYIDKKIEKLKTDLEMKKMNRK